MTYAALLAAICRAQLPWHERGLVLSTGLASKQSDLADAGRTNAIAEFDTHARGRDETGVKRSAAPGAAGDPDRGRFRTVNLKPAAGHLKSAVSYR